MPKAKTNTVAVLIGLLVLVVAAAAAVLWFLPGAEPLLPELPSPSGDAPLFTNDTTPASSGAAPTSFNLKLFERSGYQALNLPLIQNGSLPVAPPPGIGKANPFL